MPSSSGPSSEHDLSAAVEKVTQAKACVLHAQSLLAESLAALDQLVQDSGIPMETIHQDGWILYRSEGRTTYSYPPAIKALEASLKSDKELAVALGTATAKVGQPFWTIKQTNDPLF